LAVPAASLGISQKNTIALLPREIAGQKIDYIVLDDASDPTFAAKTVASSPVKIMSTH
jgi:branched-chain amino acid transport system substrate-binding protein